MTTAPFYFVFAACLITVSTSKSRRDLPINRNCHFDNEISSELCNKGDLISSEVVDCERDVLRYQIRQTCVPHLNSLFSKVTEPPDLSYGVNCTPKTNLPMLCGSSGTDTRCVCDKSYSYLTNQCRCQYWPLVDYRSDKPSFCTQYDHGGTKRVHFYTCCNNCNDNDDTCKGTTYQGGGSTEEYCNSCGEKKGRGRATYHFNCVSCAQQSYCKSICDRGFKQKNIPGYCWKWSTCFRDCCHIASYSQEKRNTREVVEVGDFCGDFICQEGEDERSCSIDCCPLRQPENCKKTCVTDTDICCKEKCGIEGTGDCMLDEEDNGATVYIDCFALICALSLYMLL